MLLPLPIALALESAFSAVLSLDQQAQTRLSALSGKLFDVHWLGVDLHMYCLVHHDKVELLRYFDGEVDTTIRGAPIAMLSLGSGNRALFTGQVEILGDIKAGQQFRRLLGTLSIDWEEHLATITGDIAAHQIGNLVRGTDRWLGRSAQSLRADVSEYLREERQDLPSANECDEFYQHVDQLRDDVERLEARLNRIDDSCKEA